MASADENGFVMSRDKALKLVSDTYGGSPQITENFKVTDWQITKSLSFSQRFQYGLR